MGGRKLWVRGLVVFMMLCVGLACSSSSTTNNNGVVTTGLSTCQSACAKPCGVDADCQTSQGELCCDYGAAGKVCQSAQSCPQFCADDSTCDSATGQACVSTSLAASAKKSCQKAAVGLTFCKVDSDCTGAGDVCCSIYNEGICVPGNECPKACNASSDCQTSLGEVCCTSVKAVDPSLAAAGLCLNPTYEACPKACSASSDCAATGELCCNGICQKTCPKPCKSDDDCSGNARICCATSAAQGAPPPHLFKTGATCSGTPSHQTCAQCSATVGCAGCEGCGTPGNCAGVPATKDCGTCGASYGCANCAGCIAGPVGQGSCVGTPSAVTCSQLSSTSCSQYAGCALSAGTCGGFTSYSSCATCPVSYCGLSECRGCTPVTAPGTCTGTPYACSTWTSTTTNYQTQCMAEGCTWTVSGAGGTCSGPPGPAACNTYVTAATCTYGCSWQAGATTCTGTLTPCAQLTDQTSCSGQGCSWSGGTCSGNVTSCSALTTQPTCTTPGCAWSTTQCNGTLTACPQIVSQSACQMQRGCLWQSTSSICTGTVSPCTELGTDVTCRAQQGCIWQ